MPKDHTTDWAQTDTTYNRVLYATSLAKVKKACLQRIYRAGRSQYYEKEPQSPPKKPRYPPPGIERLDGKQRG